MVKGLDELVDFAVERIALCGTQGANAYTVKTIVRDFYDVAQPVGGDAAPELAPHVDDSFCSKVWTWLCKHKDVRVRTRAIPAPVLVGEAAGIPHEDDKEHYLTVKTARMWHALAGHGPDPKRIPPMSFTILSIVASRGAAGILQPEITSISGQDKRSVPKRTDDLARAGYIEKRTVLAKGTHKTSLCTLIRFVEETATAEGDEETRNPADLLELAFKDSIVRHEAFILSAMPLIKEAGVITLNDLKRHYDILGRRWESRVLSDFVLRMEVMGLVAKLRAKVDGFEDTNHTMRSVQFLREPSVTEIQTFCALGRLDSPSRRERFESALADKAAESLPDVQDDEEAFDGETNEDQRRVILGDLAQRERAESAKPIDWTPMLSINHNMFNVIDRAGVAGLSTMTLIERLGGPFYRRPIEHMAAQMTDAWEGAQPEYLHHLSAIRDVGQSARFNYYIYRSYRNFDEATKLGHTTWEAMTSSGGAQPTYQTPKWIKNMPLDEWGFPEIRNSLLLGDGHASAADARSALRAIRQPVRILGDNASFGEGGKGRVDRAAPARHPEANRSRPSATPAGRHVTMLAEESGILKEQGESASDPESPLDLLLTQRPATRGQRGRPPSSQRTPKSPSKRALREQTAHDHGSDEESATYRDIGSPRSALQPKGIPPRPLAVFREQMMKVADRIVRKELEIPKSQPLVTKKRTKAQHDTAILGASASVERESMEKALNDNKKRTLSPAADEPHAKRLKANQAEQEPVSHTTLREYRTRVNVLVKELVDLNRAGVYINPPQYLAWKKGRPRASALVVVKNNRLKEFAWFQASDEPGDKIYLGPGVDKRTRKTDRQIHSNVEESEGNVRLETPQTSSTLKKTVEPISHVSVDDESDSDVAQQSDLAQLQKAFSMTKRAPTSVNQLPKDSPAPKLVTPTTPKTLKRSRLPKDAIASPGTSWVDFKSAKATSRSAQVIPDGNETSPDPTATQEYDDGDPVVETHGDFSFVETSSSIPSTSLGRSISKIMSPRSGLGKRRKLNPAIRPATPSRTEADIGGDGDVENLTGSSRRTAAPKSSGNPATMTARHFVASLDPKRKIPFHASFKGMAKHQPYGCEMCGKRYRNPGGLEYHVDHSPKCYPERYAVAQQRKDLRARELYGQSSNHTHVAYDPQTQDMLSLSDEDEETVQATSVQDNGGHQDTARNISPNPPPFTPLIRDQTDVLVDEETQADESAQSPAKTVKKDQRTKSGTMLGGGSIMHKRYEIILDLLKSFDGVIPGDRALHAVFITAWRKSGGEGSPDIGTLRRTINNLCSQLKINRLYLAFRAGNAAHTASVLTLPDIAPDSEAVMKTLRLFETACPRMPVPEGFEIADDLKSRPQHYPGHPRLSNHAERYPPKAEVVVKRLRQPLMPSTRAAAQAPAWARWAEMNTLPIKGRNGTLDFAHTRDDFMEATLDEIEDGVKLPSGHLSAPAKKRHAAQMPSQPTFSRRRTDGNTMHARIQWAKQARQRELDADMAEIAALEADVTEEQAEMQSSFSLGDDYRPSRFEPRQIAMSASRGKFTSHTGSNGLRWAPIINRDGPIAKSARLSKPGIVLRPVSSDIVDGEDMASDIPEEDAPAMTLPRLQGFRQAPRSRLVFPVIKPAVPMVDLVVNPVAWLIDIRKPARKVLSREMQLLTTMTDPDQGFHNTSGTFSTEFSVWRRLRPQMQIAVPRQSEYEARMAAAFNELEFRPQAMGRPPTGFYDIGAVEKWESHHREDLTANMELIQTRWINHTVEDDIAANVRWNTGSDLRTNLDQPIELGDKGLLRGSRRNKVLRRPPIHIRKGPPSELNSTQDGSNTRSSKRTPAKSRQTRLDYVNENGHAESSPMLEGGRRGPQTKRYLKKDQLELAMAAIVLAQVLAGGKSHTLDWRVVECALDGVELDTTFLRQRWFTIRYQNSIRLAELRDSFQRNFIRAAARDEVDVPDFDNAADYDWSSMLRWTMDHVMKDPQPEPCKTEFEPLPKTRAEFDEGHTLAQDVVYDFPDQDQYKPLVTIQRKEELMVEIDWSTSLRETHVPSFDEVSMASKAESWLRSNVLAKGHGYDAPVSRTLLEQLPGPVLDQALTTYIDKKWLRVLNKGRLGPGRNYVTNGDFTKLLRPDVRARDTCHPAVAFKLALDDAFAAPQKEHVSTLESQAGEAIALLNLLAARRVELTPLLPPVTHASDPVQIDKSTGVARKHLSIYGLAPGNYVTKTLAKHEFHMDVCVRPTQAYLPGTGPVALSGTGKPQVPAPHLDKITGLMRSDRPTPIWYDLQGRLSADVWSELVMCIVLDLVSQCGKSGAAMARRYDGAVAAWEIDCVLAWLEAVGAARQVVRRDGSMGGWTASEWWWCVFGSISNDGEASGDDEDGDKEPRRRGKGKEARETRRVSFALPEDRDSTAEQMLQA